MPNAKGEEGGDIAEKLLSMSKRRGFFWPSFEIYGGVAGFYDYGPLGTIFRNNISGVWRRLFRAEGFYEIDTPTVNPEVVFRSSGHLDFFTDFLVDCEKCHESFRADHIVDIGGEPATLETISARIASGDARCPRCGSRSFSSPRPFNLMFQTHIGPSGNKPGYLRPETAQGIFMSFQQLNRFFREKLPFGAIQTGRGYRNEISPRQGLVRLRELNMLEAELFVDPEQKHWRGFDSIRREKLSLVPRGGKPVRVEIGKAVADGIIGSEVLAYFMHLTMKLMTEVGIDPARSRFRQHEKDEMAHYSRETWDFEAELSSGWLELGGIADRGDYDLAAHIKGSSADLTFFRRSSEERTERRMTVRANRSKLGPVYKALAGEIASAIERLPADEAAGKDHVSVKAGGSEHSIGKEFFSVAEVEEKVKGDKFVPHVIEPSLGLDRIFYSALEHSFTSAGGYTVLRLPGPVAPIKAGVFPMTSEQGLRDAAASIEGKMLAAGMEPYYDETGSIGRRYARMDEVGTPYCITVDNTTLDEETVTIRERDTRRQVRTPLDDVVNSLARLLSGERLDRVGVLTEAAEEEKGENEAE